jgi:hypothetical protein
MTPSIRSAIVAALIGPLAAVITAQAPVQNAKIDTRSASQGLNREVTAALARAMPSWIGYRLPAAAGSRRSCGFNNRIMLEGPTEFIVLARTEGGRVVRLRTATPECEVDAGGMPLVWLTDVKASESVDWLASLLTSAPESRNGMDQIVRPALRAIAMHVDAGAPKLLEIARGTKNAEVRKQAMSQLSQSTDPRAITVFEDTLTK